MHAWRIEAFDSINRASMAQDIPFMTKVTLLPFRSPIYIYSYSSRHSSGAFFNPDSLILQLYISYNSALDV
jgi:hypothetical protein